MNAVRYAQGMGPKENRREDARTQGRSALHGHHIQSQAPKPNRIKLLALYVGERTEADPAIQFTKLPHRYHWSMEGQCSN